MHGDIKRLYAAADAAQIEELRLELQSYDKESLLRGINVLSVIIGNAALLAAEQCDE